VVALVQEAWHQLACVGKTENTTWEKVGRMELETWEPPLLKFVLERHGRTLNGSTRADLHHWVVNVQEGTRAIVKEGWRQLRPTAARVSVTPIAGEIAGIILKGGKHECLRWSNDQRKVAINLKALLGSGCQQTVTGRRKRFQAVIEPILTAKGWQRGSTRGVFLRA
jgi:hypothetical protein